eukprot:TRINITY_DN113_c0_g1_i1.p1 TRINITY_DN113_c0_g1~~TRINITY_DN113_c0_g1_i1.p1  ORF type:complete len:845 (+),score=154.72 TRINITY_DN113_c0_g1_i1:135-2669(+)
MASQQPKPESNQQMLNAYIYDYLKRQNYKQAADTFFKEAAVSPQISVLQAPGGFLAEWWAIFWDIFSATNRKASSPEARAYVEYHKQRSTPPIGRPAIPPGMAAAPYGNSGQASFPAGRNGVFAAPPDKRPMEMMMPYGMPPGPGGQRPPPHPGMAYPQSPVSPQSPMPGGQPPAGPGGPPRGLRTSGGPNSMYGQLPPTPPNSMYPPSGGPNAPGGPPGGMPGGYVQPGQPWAGPNPNYGVPSPGGPLTPTNGGEMGQHRGSFSGPTPGMPDNQANTGGRGSPAPPAPPPAAPAPSGAPPKAKQAGRKKGETTRAKAAGAAQSPQGPASAPVQSPQGPAQQPGPQPVQSPNSGAGGGGSQPGPQMPAGGWSRVPGPQQTMSMYGGPPQGGRPQYATGPGMGGPSGGFPGEMPPVSPTMGNSDMMQVDQMDPRMKGQGGPGSVMMPGGPGAGPMRRGGGAQQILSKLTSETKTSFEPPPAGSMDGPGPMPRPGPGPQPGPPGSNQFMFPAHTYGPGGPGGPIPPPGSMGMPLPPGVVQMNPGGPVPPGGPDSKKRKMPPQNNLVQNLDFQRQQQHQGGPPPGPQGMPQRMGRGGPMPPGVPFEQAGQFMGRGGPAPPQYMIPTDIPPGHMPPGAQQQHGMPPQHMGPGPHHHGPVPGHPHPMHMGPGGPVNQGPGMGMMPGMMPPMSNGMSSGPAPSDMMSGITSSSVPDVAPDLPPSLTGAKAGDDLFGSDMDGVVPGPNQDALVDSWMNDDTETSASKGAGSSSRGTAGLDGSGESDGSSNNNDGGAGGASASSGSGETDHKSVGGSSANTGASSAPTPPPSSSGMGEGGDLENLDLLHDFS